jgi:hypothetical protein
MNLKAKLVLSVRAAFVTAGVIFLHSAEAKTPVAPQTSSSTAEGEFSRQHPLTYIYRDVIPTICHEGQPEQVDTIITVFQPRKIPILELTYERGQQILRPLSPVTDEVAFKEFMDKDAKKLHPQCEPFYHPMDDEPPIKLLTRDETLREALNELQRHVPLDWHTVSHTLKCDPLKWGADSVTIEAVLYITSPIDIPNLLFRYEHGDASFKANKQSAEANKQININTPVFEQIAPHISEGILSASIDVCTNRWRRSLSPGMRAAWEEIDRLSMTTKLPELPEPPVDCFIPGMAQKICAYYGEDYSGGPGH